MPHQDWEQRLNGYFVAFCRKTFRWSPVYREAKRKALIEVKDGVEWYRCNECKKAVKRKDKQVDHIVPVVDPDKGWDGSWDEYHDRMFTSLDNLAILCKDCHKKKSALEMKKRRNRNVKSRRKRASKL